MAMDDLIRLFRYDGMISSNVTIRMLHTPPVNKSYSQSDLLYWLLSFEAKRRIRAHHQKVINGFVMPSYPTCLLPLIGITDETALRRGVLRKDNIEIIR